MRAFTARSNRALLSEALAECVEQTQLFLVGKTGVDAPHVTVAFASHVGAARELRDAFVALGWPAIGARATALSAPEDDGAWGGTDAGDEASDLAYVPFVQLTSIVLGDRNGSASVALSATTPPSGGAAHLMLVSSDEQRPPPPPQRDAEPTARATLLGAHCELFCADSLLERGGVVALTLPAAMPRADEHVAELAAATVGELALHHFKCDARVGDALFGPVPAVVRGEHSDFASTVRGVGDLQRLLLSAIDDDAASRGAGSTGGSGLGDGDDDALRALFGDGDGDGDATAEVEREGAGGEVQTMLLDLALPRGAAPLFPYCARRHTFETPRERLLLRRVVQEGELFALPAPGGDVGCFATISDVAGFGAAERSTRDDVRLTATLTGAPQRFSLHRAWVEPRAFGLRAGAMSMLRDEAWVSGGATERRAAEAERSARTLATALATNLAARGESALAETLQRSVETVDAEMDEEAARSKFSWLLCGALSSETCGAVPPALRHQWLATRSPTARLESAADVLRYLTK